LRKVLAYKQDITAEERLHVKTMLESRT